MKQHLGPYLGKSFKHFLIDSYEAGTQSWTPAFRTEFQKRKGYDPLPWLLTFQNRTVGDKDLSARFKWDHEDVIRTLYYENGWLTGHGKIKTVGMDLQFEPYGGQFDTVEGTALADIPMGEFWTGRAGGINGTVVAAARAAGRTVVGAEAFTGPPDLSKWSETPAFLKHPPMAPCQRGQPIDPPPLGSSTLRRSLQARHGHGLVGHALQPSSDLGQGWHRRFSNISAAPRRCSRQAKHRRTS